jgi:hypothetical protein
MGTFMVGYDLKKPGQDYKDLIAKLKSYPNWWHYLDSTWLVVANTSVVTIRDELRDLMDSNDCLLVIEVTGDAWASSINKQANDWLHSNMAGVSVR